MIYLDCFPTRVSVPPETQITIACNGAGGRIGFEINAYRAGPLMRVVMRTPSGLDGGCANWGWMLVVSAGPFEASRSKGAVSGAAAFRGG